MSRSSPVTIDIAGAGGSRWMPLEPSRWRSATKRLLDIVASLGGLVVLSPLLLLIAIAIKLDSPGPVFFRQRRVGRGFREFQILKFRSMIVDAPKVGGPLTVGGDARITRVGNLVRKAKFDELPQLWNVLRGEMSLVGPRPEVPRYVELFRSDYESILQVRPGITDLASIEYCDESELLGRASDPEREYVTTILPRKILLARQYVERSSPLFDIEVIIKTLWRIVRRR